MKTLWTVVHLTVQYLAFSPYNKHCPWQSDAKHCNVANI